MTNELPSKPSNLVDLRSDTLTKPSEEMRLAMANADVNDDVIDVDPTVKRLQETVASMLGKEAAMFMPSGTMTNQIAVRLHCKPGDELICEEGCHIYNYEQGAYASLSGIATRTVASEGNMMQVAQLKNLVRPFNEHNTQTRLVCLENTHNKGGGKIQPIDQVQEICEWAHSKGLKTHLDGARLFNAVVGSGVPPAEWSAGFDTVSVCFSKGLGAPVGSALAGSAEMVAELRRHRKLFGGAMRQSGIIAAGALFAIENNVDRLAEDHQTANLLATKISEIDGLNIDTNDVHTNIVIFEVDERLAAADVFCERLLEEGVWMYPFSHCHVRAVTHLHISNEDILRAVDRIKTTVESLHQTAG